MSGVITPERANEIRAAASQAAANVVLRALICVIKDGDAGDKTRETKRDVLCKQVESFIPKEIGYMTLTFEDITDLKLVIQLDVVPRDHVVDIAVPSEKYARDLYEQYNLLKQLAMTYWQDFRMRNSVLIEEIEEFRPDVEFMLVVDPANPTTMYFDPLCPMRPGIKGAVVDKKGRIMRMQ